MEMELIRTERPVPNSSIDFQDWRQLPFLSSMDILLQDGIFLKSKGLFVGC